LGQLGQSDLEHGKPFGDENQEPALEKNEKGFKKLL
jgi:hypothetical protein